MKNVGMMIYIFSMMIYILRTKLGHLVSKTWSPNQIKGKSFEHNGYVLYPTIDM